MPLTAPPPHRRVVSRKPEATGAPRPVGRPAEWNVLLGKFKGGRRVKKGPYKNHSTSVAAASWFNAQMRDKDPQSYEDGFRFRSNKKAFVVVRQID